MALSSEDDKGRFEKADPHIRALLDRPEPKAQAFGHLFAGSIDLDRSNNTRDARAGDRGAPPSELANRLRSSAVKHLKIAATSLPDVAEAQARYGVALVLAGEQNLGRQFLQTACGWAASILSFSSGRRGPSSRPAIPKKPSRSWSHSCARSPRATLHASWKGAFTF